MTKKDLEVRISQAIFDCIDNIAIEFKLDDLDLVFINDTVEDIAAILYESRVKTKGEKEDEIENMKEDEAMEDYYDEKYGDKLN